MNSIFDKFCSRAPHADTVLSSSGGERRGVCGVGEVDWVSRKSYSERGDVLQEGVLGVASSPVGTGVVSSFILLADIASIFWGWVVQ